MTDDDQAGCVLITHEMADILVALRDRTVVQVLAAVSGEHVTVADLTGALGVDAATVGKAVRVLGAAGLIKTEREGSVRWLHFDPAPLDALAAQLEMAVSADLLAPSVPSEVAVFFQGTRLRQMPAQYSRQIMVLRYLVQEFEENRDYAEAEINQIIGRRFADTATIRRGFVDEGLMVRSGGIYRRVVRPD